MKNLGTIIGRAVLIALIGAVLGVGANLVSSSAIPWIYKPPEQVEISGVKVTLVDENRAREYLDDPGAVFVDTRSDEDFQKGHVRGALNIPSYEMERSYPMVAALMPEDYRIVLYCHGPECDMAEEVAGFLAQLGYERMMIMVSGYPAWEMSGFPVEKGRDAGP